LFGIIGLPKANQDATAQGIVYRSKRNKAFLFKDDITTVLNNLISGGGNWVDLN